MLRTYLRKDTPPQQINMLKMHSSKTKPSNILQKLNCCSGNITYSIEKLGYKLCDFTPLVIQRNRTAVKKINIGTKTDMTF